LLQQKVPAAICKVVLVLLAGLANRLLARVLLELLSASVDYLKQQQETENSARSRHVRMYERVLGWVPLSPFARFSTAQGDIRHSQRTHPMRNVAILRTRWSPGFRVFETNDSRPCSELLVTFKLLYFYALQDSAPPFMASMPTSSRWKST